MKLRALSASLSTALVLGGVVTAMAVPARPGIINMTQPDGSRIAVRLIGDEDHHYYTDADGNRLSVDADGYLVPAGDVEETVAATDRYRIRQAAGSKYTSYPTTGKQKALIILVEFANNSFTYGHDSFERMLNETGYSDYGAAGSARDYYVENSGGNFLPDFDVYGPVKLANNMTYYSANDDAKAYEMVVEACRQLDGDIDFSQYDRDGDGWVDNIYVFYAGYGEADGGGTNTVWPHSSNVYRKGTTLFLDGVQIGQYACSNELIANSRSMVGIGTFCHEFGHVLGLPDLYSTASSSAVTVGNWSLMSYGNYANDGRCPVALTAYERYFLGWTDPIVISGDCTVLVPEIGRNLGYRINGADSEEYFILEYRRKTGWDAYAPGEGLLVWHIDYDRDQWNMNTPNNVDSHLRVRILPADGVLSYNGDAGDTYPGTSGVNSIAEFRSWNGFSSGIHLSGIAPEDGYMKLTVNNGSNGIASPSLSTSEVTDCDAVVNFSDNTLAQRLLSISYTEEGRTRFVPGYTFRNIGTDGMHAVENLSPETKYTVSASNLIGSEISKATENSFTTSEAGIRFFAPQNVTASEIRSTTFTLSWDALPSATDYFVTVYHEGEGAAGENVIDFANKTDLPDGWYTTAINTMSVNGYYGEAAPSLRMSSNAEMIESPVFPSEVQSLSFWIRGYQAAAAATLNVYGSVDGEWTLIESIGNIDNSAGKTISYSASRLAGANALRFVYNSPTGSGSVCIDDIRVGLGNETVVITDLDAASSGGRTSKEIEGLTPLTKYYFYVTATDGRHTSLQSATGSVETTKSSGISGMEADDAPVFIYTIDGVPVSGHDMRDLAPGIYIMRQGNVTTKIIKEK